MLEPIALITFDLDDTLWPCMPTIMAAEQTLFDWLAGQSPELAADHDICSLRDQRMALVAQRPELAHDLTLLRKQSLQDLAEQYGLPSTLPEQGTALFRRERNRVSPYEEVPEVLRLLGQHFVLIALSNGNAQIEHTPLANCFSHVFLAEEVGAAKPDPALFLAASEASGIELSRALHVGDDPERDIQAASQLGMRTAWVNRNNNPWPARLAAPNWQLSHLDELLGYLRIEA